MANYMCEYTKSVDKILEKNYDKEELNNIINIHLTKISFYQHERLVHLLVTTLFSLLDIIMLSVFFISDNLFCLLLVFLFTILLVPYIFHYYFLENSVHKMYRQYDTMKEKIDK